MAQEKHIIDLEETKEFESQEFDNGIIFRADCSKVLQKLETNSAEIAVTSPPYNLCKRYVDSSTKTAKQMSKKLEKWYFDEMPEWEYQGWQQSVIFELMRVCRSSIFYNHKIRFAWHSRNLYRNDNNIHHPMHWLHRFPIWQEIIWDRCGIGNPNNRYHCQDERIYQIQKPAKWNNSQGLTNIWRIAPTKNINHVCTFPEKLVDNCMLPTTDKNDVIIDPFLGSGTSAISAIKNGRKFIGIEKDKNYFDIACKNVIEAEQAEHFTQCQMF